MLSLQDLATELLPTTSLGPFLSPSPPRANRPFRQQPAAAASVDSHDRTPSSSPLRPTAAAAASHSNSNSSSNNNKKKNNDIIVEDHHHHQQQQQQQQQQHQHQQPEQQREKEEEEEEEESSVVKTALAMTSAFALSHPTATAATNDHHDDDHDSSSRPLLPSTDNAPSTFASIEHSRPSKVGLIEPSKGESLIQEEEMMVDGDDDFPSELLIDLATGQRLTTLDLSGWTEQMRHKSTLKKIAIGR